MSDAPNAPSTFALLFAALGAGLVAVMLLAIVSPRWTGEGGTDWLITLLGGVVVAALVYAVGAARRTRTTQKEVEH